jgi:8-oxo-dGTP diphosphatase
MSAIEKVGLIVVRDGRVLLCRKRHTTALLILPGGKREHGESHLDCLARELREELGAVKLADPQYLGGYTSLAAGENRSVQIELYAGSLAGTPIPRSEIAELVWFGPDDDAAQLAPSLRDLIFPDLVRRGVLPWRYS